MMLADNKRRRQFVRA